MVLDSGVPQKCFLQRWRPFVSTSSPFPKQAFTSDNTSLGYDRWGVLNSNWPAGELQKYATGGWGKFALGKRALQVYEPCDQKDFLEASQVYIKKGIDVKAGLKFAINVDPAMSEVYLSDSTGRGLNEVLFSQTNISRSADVRATLIIIEGIPILLYAFAVSGSTPLYCTRPITKAGGNIGKPKPLTKINESISQMSSAESAGVAGGRAINERELHVVVMLEKNPAALLASTIVYDISCQTKCSPIYNFGGKVAVGKNPTLSATLSGGALTIASIANDGACVNNEKNNKQAKVASCDLVLESMEGVLSYTVGPVDAWIRLTQEEEASMSP
eukprot:UC4_evm1s919